MPVRTGHLGLAPGEACLTLAATSILELGRQVADTPDAWCYLRESYVHAQNVGRNPAVPVRNFERWLVQRDLPGEPTEPVRKVMFKDYRPAGNIYGSYVPGKNYDFVARRGNQFGFSLDDRFIVDEAHPVAFKITYYDDQPWVLTYPTKIAWTNGGLRIPCVCRCSSFLMPPLPNVNPC